MTNPIYPAATMLGAAVAISAIAVAVLVLAKKARWFGRLRSGFAVAVAATCLLIALTTAVVLGVWSYVTARQVVLNDFTQRLDAVARVAEGDLTREVKLLTARLSELADADLFAAAKTNPEAALNELTAVQKWNHRSLQFNVFDNNATLLLTSARTDAREEHNRVGVAFALEGKTFISEPYFSPAFGRNILYIAVPVLDEKSKAIGAVSMRYDIQEELHETFAAHAPNDSTNTILASADGIVLADRDHDQLAQSLKDSPILSTALSTPTGTTLLQRDEEELLVGWRQTQNPATLGGKPLLLISEISYEEVMAEVTLLRAKLLIGGAVMAGVWLLLAGGVASSVTRPLRTLLSAATKVRDGDLTTQVQLSGRDEIGQFANAFNEMVHGLAERDRVKQLFGRYLTTQVSEKILRGDVNIGGQRKRVTILFADIRDFTTISEKLAPEQVVEMLNEYFTEMVDAVFEYGGVLDKFIGDGMMAVFGSIDDSTDHARRAVQCGLRMKARLAKINGDRESRGEPAICIGIGIHTDEVVVGNIGSRKRLEYTVIGDGVNTCARVEAMNKQLGTTLLITEQTQREVGEDFTALPKPEVPAKGKSKPVRVFEVTSARQALRAAA